MLAKVLSGLSLVRHAVAITLVFGAAGASVAGAFDVAPSQSVTPVSVATTTNTTQNDNTTDLEAAVTACLATKDPASDECAKAVDLSGLSAGDFWAKVALSLNEQLGRAKNDKHDQKPDASAKPQDTNTHELIGLVTACVATHERSSEPCQKALALSGLSADDFWAKVGTLFENKKHDEPTPAASPKTTAGLSAIIGACLEKFEAAKRGTYTTPIVDTEACKKAFEATGLTPEQFYAKFFQQPRPTDKPKPTATPKPAQTVSDADLIAMVRDCFTKYNAATASKGNEDLGHAAYDACTKAMAASGLSGDAFWAKFGTPQAPKI